MNTTINIKTIFSSVRGWLILFLSSIAIGLSLSKPLISIGLVGIFVVWILDGNIPQKIKLFYTNKTAVIISSIYLISLLGLLYTSNYDFAFDDLRRKISIFGLPFLIPGFSPITKKELKFLLKIFIIGVIFSTLWSLFIYIGGLNIEIVDTRAFSRFTSHIRFGLEIALTAFLSLYFFKEEKTVKVKILWIGIFFWMILSLFLFNLFTGLAVFGVTTVLLLFLYGVFSNNKLKKRITLFVFVSLIVSSFLFTKNAINKFYADNNVTPLKEIPYSKEGEKYMSATNKTHLLSKENGYYINKNIAWHEFTKAWNNRSNIDFNDKDLKGQNLQETLIRFITSKGQRKDKEAIEALSEEEVSAIEKGVSNYKYLEMNSFSLRVHKIIWEYDDYNKTNGQNINGHSILMRWVYWKTAINIIKKNFFIGVGTGDVQEAFNQQYKADNSPLLKIYRLRTHNQYLAIFVSFGILGFLWFIYCLFYPVVKMGLHKNYAYVAFFSIFLLSMLTEDTLETQVGASFFIFFNILYIFNEKTLESI